jgi:hypothetical protein
MRATTDRMKTLGRPTTFDELLELLSPAGFDELEGEYRAMRKQFVCPFTVQTEEEYKDVAADYYALWYKTMYTYDASDRADRRHLFRLFGSERLIHSLGGVYPYFDSIKHARRGINGGMIGVIDQWTETMIRDACNIHVDLICDKHLPGDAKIWEDIGRKLIDRYGRFLCPEDDYIFYPSCRHDVVNALRAFALKRRSARDQMARMAAKESGGTR